MEYDVILRHVSADKNTLADMLSRASYLDDTSEEDEDEESIPDWSSRVEYPETQEDSDDDDNAFCELHATIVEHPSAGPETHDTEAAVPDAVVRRPFRADCYEGHLREVGKFLEELEGGNAPLETPRKVRRDALKYFLRAGLLWRRPKTMVCSYPRRVVGLLTEREAIITAVHDHHTAGHFGLARTYQKARERYFWPNQFQDIQRYVRSCAICQAHSKNKYFEELHPSFPPAINFEWYIDLVELPRCKGDRGAD
jgi:hypothetical protein